VLRWIKALRESPEKHNQPENYRQPKSKYKKDLDTVFPWNYPAKISSKHSIKAYIMRAG
jgi:hypothetical protein